MEKGISARNFNDWLTRTRIMYSSDLVTVAGKERLVQFYVRLSYKSHKFEVDINHKTAFVTYNKYQAIGYYNKVAGG